MGKVISISNQKGGVGKTTTSINLASALAVLEKKVLLLDLDPQGNTTTGLGFDKNEIKEGKKQTTYDLILDDEFELDYNQLIIKTSISNLHLIPATMDLAGAEIELTSVMAREVRLKKHLDKLKEDYDYVLLDCPPSLGLLTINSLTGSDSVLIPLQAEFFALEGLAELLNTIRLLQKVLNPNLSIEGILLTMYDARLNLCKQVEEEIREWFNDVVYNVKIPKNIKLAEAPSHGKSIIQYDILSNGAQSYIDLAKEFINKNKNR